MYATHQQEEKAVLNELERIAAAGDLEAVVREISAATHTLAGAQVFEWRLHDGNRAAGSLMQSASVQDFLFAARAPFRSLHAAPIRTASRVIGQLVIGFAEDRVSSEFRRTLTEHVGTLIGQVAGRGLSRQRQVA